MKAFIKPITLALAAAGALLFTIGCAETVVYKEKEVPVVKTQTKTRYISVPSSGPQTTIPGQPSRVNSGNSPSQFNVVPE